MPAYFVSAPPTYTSLIDGRPVRVMRPSVQYGRRVLVPSLIEFDHDGDLLVVTDDGFVEYVQPGCLRADASTAGMMRASLWQSARALMNGDFEDTVEEYGRLVEHRKRYRTGRALGDMWADDAA